MIRPGAKFPSGRYFSTPIDIGAEYGGQTRALLLRNRMFVTEVGLRPQVLTFTPRPDWEARRGAMLANGMLLPEIATPNIHEHYRAHGWPGVPLASSAPLDVTRLAADEQDDERGRPWRTTYRGPDGVVAHDYLRPDGSPFLRVPPFKFGDPDSWPSRIDRFDEAGAPLEPLGSVGAWFRGWIDHLSAGEQSFVFIDSRFSVPHLVPLRIPHLRSIYVMHNIHVLSPRRWNSDTTDMYARVLNRIGGMDAMVTLTARQRADVALRRGETDNLFVAPNPVEMPDQPVPLVERDPHLVVMLARLEKQKGLLEAVEVIDRVRRTLPGVRLDIYGEGSQRGALEAAIAEHGLVGVVTLHGHDPAARAALWRASLTLVTSLYEGWNLAMQESMSHGCPVVAYDVKYGPAEQIQDGVNGFLVPWRDQEAMAERIVRVLTEDGLRRDLAAASVARAAGSKQRFLDDWAQILGAVVDPDRTTARLGRVEPLRASVSVRCPRRPSPARWIRPRPRRLAGNERLEAEVVLDLTPETADPSLPLAPSLTWVHQRSGAVVEVPHQLTRQGTHLVVTGSVPVDDVVRVASGGWWLRVRLVLGRTSWQRRVTPDFAPRTRFTAGCFDDRGRLDLAALVGK